MRKNLKLSKLRDQLQKAQSYLEWFEIAQQIDQLSGAEKWRDDPSSNIYHADLLNKQLQLMRRLRKNGQWQLLSGVLQESLYRHLAEVTNPALYTAALSGTKRLIEDFLRESEDAMIFLAEHDTPGITPAEKLERFEQAYQVFGRSALMLSGGSAFGIYHTGVVKALWEQQLLPQIITGSSMGAIVAAGICARNDDELDEFFAHPEQIHRVALRRASLKTMLQDNLVMQPKQLMEHIVSNVGDFTFDETFQRSGRVLNITVSPTRANQKPRVLNHITAPDVMVTYAALASCAIPAVFPPVMLRSRDKNGTEAPYMQTERWIDGSVHGDIPMMRISRLLNVNHSIVSQANPFVIPFTTHRHKSGAIPFVKHFASSMFHAQASEMLETTRPAWNRTPAAPVLDKAYALARQTYLGDINIQFPFIPSMYTKVITNPDMNGLLKYIELGERATWPQIPIIRDQTMVARTFERCISRLRKQLAT